MGDFTMILSIVILGSGLYCLFAAYMLKAKGVINKSILLAKDKDPSKCKDKEAYINCVFPKVVILGIAALLFSAVDLVNSYVQEIMPVWAAAMVIFLIVLFWFGAATKKASNQYF